MKKKEKRKEKRKELKSHFCTNKTKDDAKMNVLGPL